MWMIFIIVGVVATAGVALTQRIVRGPRTLLSAIVACGVGALGFYLFRGPQTLGPETWWAETPYRESILFATMLLGMAIRYVTKAIEDRREAVAEWKKAGSVGDRPGLELDKWEFAYPLLISAITFGALLSQVKNEKLAVENVLLSFQTGFFWQTLLAAKARAD